MVTPYVVANGEKYWFHTREAALKFAEAFLADDEVAATVGRPDISVHLNPLTEPEDAEYWLGEHNG